MHGGTLPYMAPEQIEAFINPDLWDKVGARADVYSLGLVLRELLTGEKPELPDAKLTPAQVLQEVLDRRQLIDVAVSRFNPAIPRALEAIVTKCLTIAPDDRYADAEALAQDLDRFLSHRPLVGATNPSRRERVGNWVTRNRRMFTGIAGAIAVAAVFCGLWFSLSTYRPAQPPAEASPAVQAVVKMIENKQLDKAESELRSLDQDYHSCVAKLYLAFALQDDKKRQNDADDYMHAAFAATSAKSILIAWAKDHVEVATYLAKFAESRILFADEYLGEL